jgi:hypothetical protein
MRLSWKTFKIDLSSFNDFLVANVPNADGISATTGDFAVVERESFGQGDVDLVNSYYGSLTEEGEFLKLNRPSLLASAVYDLRVGMLSKEYSEFSLVERKLLVGIALTVEEEDSLL